MIKIITERIQILSLVALHFMRLLSRMIVLALPYYLLTTGCSKDKPSIAGTSGVTDSISNTSIFSDTRNIENGTMIFSSKYIDQPYIVKTSNNWVCVYTKDSSGEGGPGETIGMSISVDNGKSWLAGADIEPSGPKASSYAVPYITDYGRIYVLYGYNRSDIEVAHRSDVVGNYCFKYSDDNGLTWSPRYIIPMPLTDFDSTNEFHGKQHMFWNICKPIKANGGAYLSFTDVSNYSSFKSEGQILSMPNIESERDPSRLSWMFYPGAGLGIRNNNFGLIQEEFNIVQLSTGAFCCVYRTAEGFPAITYSQDGGKSWSTPTQMRYKTGNIIKTPLACPRIFKCSNGRYLFWFHNNGTKGFMNRNPAWVSAGTENNGKIEWSQPEILLYSRDDSVRMSYPDLVENDHGYYITETDKEHARIHSIDTEMLNNLWAQGIDKNVIAKGLQKTITPGDTSTTTLHIPSFASGGGLTLDINFTYSADLLNKEILSCKTPSGDNIFSLQVVSPSQLQLTLNDGNRSVNLMTDPVLLSGKKEHVAFVVDGLSRVVTSMVNGVLCDGGKESEFGWTKLPLGFGSAQTGVLKIDPSLKSVLSSCRIYDRYLSTSELVSNYLADQ